MQLEQRSFVQFAFDNADFNVNTLDGLGTFHALGGIMMVTPSESIIPEESFARVDRCGAPQLIRQRPPMQLQIYQPKNKQGLATITIQDVDNSQERPENIVPSSSDVAWLFVNIRIITYRMIKMLLENRIKLSVAVITAFFSSTQVIWFIYRLCTLRDINYFCNYIPVTINSYLSVVAISQVIAKSEYFRMTVYYIENHFWLEEWAPKEAKQEMKIKIGLIKKIFLSCKILSIVYFVPFNGFGYYRDMFPIMDLIRYFNAPIILGWILYRSSACLGKRLEDVAARSGSWSKWKRDKAGNVKTNPLKRATSTPTILIKWVILNITKDLENLHNHEFNIIDDDNCQKIIAARLKKCFKQYAYKVKKYFYLTGAWPLAGIVILIGCLLYIFLDQSNKGSTFAMVQEISGCVVAVFTFSFLGQTFQIQMSEILDAALQAKWYYFNTKNRKIFLIFLQNLSKDVNLEIAGFFSVNLELSIWIFNKSFAILSVFGTTE
ncbi:uncharacterized protein LOC126742833 [Anthonomus grandis grandis]|uniref:uncharacterized protein LOC126742833 n=1 Tax=Anthonomus grandis grandis TaxID=2921223 RepID=UPI0021659C24|nr:uncharacterized protein LOC126742833 [Anthonomus grandis grandis]